MSTSGASLPDFVQMECLSQSSRAFRVMSGNRIGYLFFDRGQIIHALTGEQTGEAAALEILNWRDGSVERCSLGWPEVPTINSSWQNLLLLAAQARDESGRHTLVSFPQNRMASTRPPTDTNTLPRQEEPKMNAPPISQTLTLSNLQAFVRMDAQGGVITAKGAADALTPIAAYTARLADLVGNLLGMEGLMSLEASFPSSRLMIHIERSGNIVALRAGSDADLSGLRERFGL